jgi:hypothetical protein
VVIQDGDKFFSYKHLDSIDVDYDQNTVASMQI